jgi:hypothetical protein
LSPYPSRPSQSRKLDRGPAQRWHGTSGRQEVDRSAPSAPSSFVRKSAGRVAVQVKTGRLSLRPRNWHSLWRTGLFTHSPCQDRFCGPLHAHPPSLPPSANRLVSTRTSRNEPAASLPHSARSLDDLTLRGRPIVQPFAPAPIRASLDPPGKRVIPTAAARLYQTRPSLTITSSSALR